ncbi:hypothetical protein BO71DRAFT_454298 [Aspergillus ellipticus CBS 707.79]|uniref:Uncharacterized protein n=1 Tax=Aspergillus ellipticus CBS 707.79 TaxID=1448320 RepID=A0A319EAG1_9EURO|nr:hypothetical protein BO71DRAFT_454298 [Aspergillus ellipticus CBS 707.79]
MQQRMANTQKHWIYFPLNRHEYVKAAWIWKCRICRGPASNPILVLQSSLGRTITFGPQFPARIIDQHEYISEFGVTCNDPNDAVGPLEPSPPMDTRLDPPAIPPRRGSIASTWYMNKASLDGLVKVQVRWDHDLTQETLRPMYLETSVTDGREYIKDIRSGVHDNDTEL